MNITVLSDKGGVGKTVTAVHLAGYISEVFEGEEVVLVDSDPNGSALDYAHDGGGRLPFSVIEAGERIRADHVVLDSQGRLDDEDLAEVVTGSDFLVVPSFGDRMSLRVLLRNLKEINALGGAPYRVLLTMVPWWEARVHCPGLEELRVAGTPHFEAVVEQRRAFVLASDEGVMARDLGGRRAQAAWRDYKTVGDEMMSALREERVL